MRSWQLAANELGGIRKDVAAAHCDRWPKVVEVINESLDGEYGEQVAAVEWSD